ncbi:MAG: hypothetical protein V4772_17975 [Pseudomonadota bacterium]
MIHKRHLIWLAAGLLANICSATPAKSAVPETAAESPGNQKLRQLMEQRRAAATAGQASGYASAAGPTPERLQERADLLEKGETALSRLEVDKALLAFDKAALILHAADTEIALVRAYMQGGEYRRALAFGAHTAGAHLDVVGGSALYAWLLHMGGQPAIAQRLLTEAQTRVPGNALLKDVQTQLRSATPLASPEVLVLPTRLAPYSSAPKLPAHARVAGSGLLLQDGKEALAALSQLPASGSIWVRNGLGQMSKATIKKRLPKLGVALLGLNKPLPAPGNIEVQTTPAFPGSVGFTVEYVATSHALPAWPILRSGFFGSFLTNGTDRKLGIDMPPGARGGPVFDGTGHLAGMAVQGKPGDGDLLIGSGLLNEALQNPRAVRAKSSLGQLVPAAAVPRASADMIYETSLRLTLQIITAP